MQQSSRLAAMLPCFGAALLLLSFVSTAAAPPASGSSDQLPRDADSATPVDPSAARSEPKATAAAKSSGRIDGYLAGGRWREGSRLVDVVGQFKISGDRIAFQTDDGKTRVACLENLNSERVARIVSESPDALLWVVQGTITEFRHENYLLITQAVIRARVGRNPPVGGER
jgi:hypothetical protein